MLRRLSSFRIRLLALVLLAALPGFFVMQYAASLGREMALILATGLTLLAAWIGADVLVLRPVRALTRAAKRLESGDLAARSDLARVGGELGELGSAFDEMALQARAEERDRMEQAAREQNEFLETVIQSLVHPFYVIAAHDYTILLANAAAGREIIPAVSTCYELVHGNPKPCSELGTACPLEMARSTGKPATAVHTHHDSLGNPRQVQVYATPLLDAQNHVSRVIEYYLDITERTKAEEDLASANERLAITLTSIGDGIIATDLDERIVLLNPAAEQLTGWSQAEAIGAPLLDVFRIVNAKTRQPVPDPARQALERQQVQGLWPDTALVTRDGTERFISSTVSPVRNRAGQITGVVLVLRDITRLKQAEEALKESQEYTRALIDSSLDMIIAVDRYRRITEFNRAAQETFGYELDEIIGRGADVLYANPEEDAAVYKAVAETGRCAREVLSRRKDGHVFPCYLSASSLRNARGETIGQMGISRDTTRLKQAEEQNVKSERLAALGRMAAALAHEINNPLQAIQSTLDLVLDFALDPREREEALQNVRQEIERLSAINQRILQFARPAQGTRRVMSLSALVLQTLALASKHLQRVQVRVTTDLSDDLLVPVAPEQLVQVILNLVLNAIEAAGEGGHLHISTRAEGDEAALTFTNDGPRIPPHVMEHIFEPFFTTKPDGSGLGLSVSANIIQQHGGTIRVENLDGRGVVFTVRLPRVWSNQE